VVLGLAHVVTGGWAIAAYLVGAIAFVSGLDLSLTAFLVGIVAVFLIILSFDSKMNWFLGLFSPELAATTGVKLERLNLYFLLTFSLSVLVGFVSWDRSLPEHWY
jgi:ABC-type Mn2+/Zn2+ transport system permease subunit